MKSGWKGGKGRGGEASSPKHHERRGDGGENCPLLFGRRRYLDLLLLPPSHRITSQLVEQIVVTATVVGEGSVAALLGTPHAARGPI